MASNEQKYLTTSEVARMFRVDRKTVNSWVREEKIPSTKSMDGRNLFPKQEILDLLEAKTTQREEEQ